MKPLTELARAVVDGLGQRFSSVERAFAAVEASLRLMGGVPVPDDLLADVGIVADVVNEAAGERLRMAPCRRLLVAVSELLAERIVGRTA